MKTQKEQIEKPDSRENGEFKNSRVLVSKHKETYQRIRSSTYLKML
jgi:hypothetical protein